MTELALNPILSVRTLASNGMTTNIQSADPKKEKSIKISSYLKKKNPKFFLKVEDLLINEKKLDQIDLTESETKKLEEAQVLVRRDEFSHFPRFKCQVDTDTVQEMEGDANFDAEQWIINPDISFSPSFSPPIEAIQRCHNLRIDQVIERSQRNHVWIKDYITHAWWPYSVGDKLLVKMDGNSTGSIDFYGLTGKELQILKTIHFIIPADHQKIRKQAVATQSSQYKGSGSIHLKNLVNPIIQRALARYLKSLKKEGFLRWGDFQSGRRYWAHNEVINRYVQAQLCDYLCEVVQEPWTPAFSYYVSYQDGSSLKKHIDRPQASLSLSLLIDFGKEDSSLEDSWPIYVEKEEGSDEYHEYVVGTGNASLFEGAKHVHYRLPIPKGHYSMSMLFHFIRSDFTGRVI